MLGGLGFWEIAVIMAVILLIFGPKKLPELARNLGKCIKEFKKATSDFRSTVDYEMSQPATPPPATTPPPAKQLPPQSEDEAEVVPVEATAKTSESPAESTEPAKEKLPS